MAQNTQQPKGTFARITNFFRGNSSSSQNSLSWKQSGEQETWAERAVDVLIIKLKKQGKQPLIDLEEALKAKDPNKPSKCVTIPRSMDGRLQISNCKALPHVVYCRVWRWPDLQSHHELRATRYCQYPFSAKLSDVCINPYHYERVEAHVLPPILVVPYREGAPGFSLLPQQTEKVQHNRMPGNVVVPLNGFSNNSCSSAQSSPVSTLSSSSQCYQQQPQSTPGFSGQSIMPNNQSTFAQPNAVQVHYEEPEIWAEIAYYELNCRVGESFKCASSPITIDGFTNPSKNSNRFCLGQLSNVNRNSTIEATRRHIGKGVHIYSEGDDIFLQCLSDCPVFVQSRMANYLGNYGWDSVMKLLPGYSVRVFNNNEFYRLLEQAVQSGFERTFDMLKVCTFRISFVKGWGQRYRRQDVTSTPCWIEVHLHGPSKWLDRVLQEMGSPLYAISSVS